MKKKDIICKNCGNNEEFYVKEQYKGVCYAYIRTDNEVPDNTGMYDNAIHKPKSKFIYCADCDRRVCKIEDVEDLYISVEQ